MHATAVVAVRTIWAFGERRLSHLLVRRHKLLEEDPGALEDGTILSPMAAVHLCLVCTRSQASRNCHCNWLREPHSVRRTHTAIRVNAATSLPGKPMQKRKFSWQPNTFKRALHKGALPIAFSCFQSTVEKVLNRCAKAARNLLHWHSLEGFSRPITRVHFGLLLIALGKG